MISQALPDKAYTWHFKPRGGSGKPCSICGIGTKWKGLHRAFRPDEGKQATHVVRGDNDKADREVMPYGANAQSPKGRTINRGPTGPTKRVTTMVARAASALAMGKTFDEVAAELGQKTVDIRDWQTRHAELWHMAYDRAMKNVRLLVLSQAGTEAVTADPSAFVAMARGCERWSRERGEVLFPVSKEQTLSSFFEKYYRPHCLSDASKGAIELYRLTLRLWTYFTGDPPLKEITIDTLATFRDCQSRMRGRNAADRRSPNTVRTSLRTIQTLLDKAGPPGRRNRDAADVISRVPYAKPPREVWREPRIVSPEHIEAVYLAAVCMELPRIPGFKPAAWWRALLVTTYNLGLRGGTLFTLRMTDIKWEKRVVVVRPEGIKTGRGLTLPLNAAVFDHLQAIRTDRELLFPWPHNNRWFHRKFHHLQTEAGIPPAEHFGLHMLRKTAATILWEHSPAAAQLMLGHAGSRVTQQHYVNRVGILARAIEAMPQPAAFANLPGVKTA